MAFAGFLGCGSSSTPSGGGTFTTSVSGSKPLNTLTSSEKQQLCSEVATYFRSPAVIRLECKFAGVLSAEFAAAFDNTITDAELQAACTQAVNQCVSSSANADGGTSTQTCNANQTIPATCTATVAEYSACLTTFPQTLGGSAPECTSLTRASLNMDAGAADPTPSPTSSPACATFSAKCPGAFDSSTNADAGP